jgi:hypothetical protein
MEQDVKDAACNAANAICDALRYFGDLSYAVLPRQVAHDLGELNKSFLNGVRNILDKEIEWVDERVAGGDKMREEWQRRCEHDDPAASAEPAN